LFSHIYSCQLTEHLASYGLNCNRLPWQQTGKLLGCIKIELRAAEQLTQAKPVLDRTQFAL
jgi:hypothetical protein